MAGTLRNGISACRDMHKDVHLFVIDVFQVKLCRRA